MTRPSGALAAAAAALSVSCLVSCPGTLLAADDLPQVKLSASNAVEACATPARLMAFLHANNDKLDPRYEGIADAYKTNGEALGVRWDYAFYQMLLETAHLKYTGDVDAKQNNFAGLGATGKGAKGESFADIPTGVKAHLEHLLIYSGEKVENPVAERTRNIQAWDVLGPWHKTFDRPITYGDIAKKWAPTTRRYTGYIKAIAGRFQSGFCQQAEPDAVASAPAPAAVSESAAAAAENASAPESAAATETVAAAAPTTSEAAAKPDAVNSAKDSAKSAVTPTDVGRSSLGAATVAPAADTGAAQAAPPVTLLNAAATETPATAPPAAKSTPEADKRVETASLNAGVKAGTDATAAAAAATQAKAKPQSPCRVFTASYGGSKAVIIKAAADKLVNYTVLDVNEGAEKRETEAYINAYAKGGEQIAEFPSPTQALDRAFELCPEN